MALNTELLTSSFAMLRDRETEFTQSFYSILFADYPQVQPLFTTTHMDEQAKKLFASLVLVVNNLTKPETLSPALKGLGTRHIDYGVLPAHYPMVGASLIKAMSTTLQDDWNTEYSEAWADAYAAITESMLEGADYPASVLDPHSSAPV